MRSQRTALIVLFFIVLFFLQLTYVQGSSSSTTYNLSHDQHHHHHHMHHDHHVECRNAGQKCQTDEHDDQDLLIGDDKRKIRTGPNPLHNR
ncbi:hypothetical protein HanRHA438_Chr14g0640271 [Helianthus annuus]|uniref:Uncharacterized protein n=1 Tax=Helianthus annuus TaxID=4232 RepID=A0A251SEE0_HELAN|nr:hypothetical protein HanXRQr2_Chr14g0629341 [Helianthus annuus]KAJ0467203.1 hypothetical protein HanIR_Chr14g0682711 [Helianthus annuus]KAJ0484660.1 hypothetical protein HanHA89_Chr14g0559341 [Helianthus annuus]KAJ0638835.1 hypothetical protein HanHA300_Chr00c0037g0686451 [Helianthus annuus]KAJ0655214.1 hypothetical protein HanLR1_Chr14g0521641 [Helianthus annuus]